MARPAAGSTPSAAQGPSTSIAQAPTPEAPGVSPQSAASQAGPFEDVAGQDSAGQDGAGQDGAGQGATAAQSAPSTPSAPAPTPTLDAMFATLPQAPIAASTPSTAPSAAPVASATIADMASQTVAQISSGASQFQITLTPEGLGQVSVTVNVGAEGKVSAAFAFEKPETAEALSGRATDLQKSLEQAGFSLSDAGLSFAVATPTGHGQGASADQNQGGALGQGAGQTGGGQGAAGQGSGQGGSGQGGSGQGSNAAFAQTTNAGSGQGGSGGQGQSWTYGQAAGRAFASASDAAAAVDQSPNSPYASRAASGLDIRI